VKLEGWLFLLNPITTISLRAAHSGGMDLGERAMTTVTNLSDFQALDPLAIFDALGWP
jgi:hypothetical protein